VVIIIQNCRRVEGVVPSVVGRNYAYERKSLVSKRRGRKRPV